MTDLGKDDLSDAILYACKATEDIKYSIALKHRPDLFRGMRLINKGKLGWKEIGVYVEENQKINDYFELEWDRDLFDCTAFNCHPNDPSKFKDEDPGTHVACDFYESAHSEVNAGGIKFETCQANCFLINKQVDPLSGKPIPSGNYFLPGLDKNGFCRAINPQLLTWATIPTSRFSSAGRVEGFNNPDLPPFTVDKNVSSMVPNYPYCQYFQKEFDPQGKDCYTTAGGYIARFFLGDVLTNFLYLENNTAIQESLPKISKIGPSAKEVILDNGSVVNLEEKEKGDLNYRKVLQSLLLREMDKDFEKDLIRRFSSYSKKYPDTFKEEEVYGLINDLMFLFTKISVGVNNIDEIKKIFLSEVVSIGENEMSEKERAYFITILNILFKYKSKIISSIRQREGAGKNYYSVTRIRNSSNNDLLPIPHVPIENFWDAPVQNIALKIWEDLLSIGRLMQGLEDNFDFLNNIVANLGTDVVVDKILDILAEGGKKITAKLTSAAMGKISTQAGVQAASFFVAASIGRRFIGLAVKSLVKVVVQMLKLLAKLATIAFNVVAMVLTFISIIGLILDFAIDTSWMNEIKYRADLEKYAHSFNESFRIKMNITDAESTTAPFSPRDLLNYVIDSNLSFSSSFESSIDPVTGETYSTYQQLMKDLFNEKPMFLEEENQLHLKHYYQYLGSRTINQYGQPIKGEEIMEHFDDKAKCDKIKEDISKILQKASIHGKVIGYNARRLLLKAALEKERECCNDNNIFTFILLSLSFFIPLALLLNITLSLPILAFLIYCLLFCVLVIKRRYIEFIKGTRLFNFEKKFDDSINMGAIKYKDILKEVAVFSRKFLIPFNKQIYDEYERI